MNFGDGQQLRKFHIVLPEDNGTAAANASTARRSTGDSLEGYVEVITHLPLKVECTVRLRGFSQTWIPTDTLNSDGFTNRVSVGRYCILTQLQRLCTQTYENILATKECFYKLPFEITVPHRLIEVPQDVQEQFLRLPPSLKHGAVYTRNGTDGVYMQPIIVYMIEAELKLLKSTSHCLTTRPRVSREISILPKYAADPPLSISDFPCEYRLTSTRTLRPRFHIRSIGTLKVSADEPMPLNIASPYPQASTSVPIRLVFQEQARYRRIPAHPRDWTFCIRTTVIAKTFHSVTPIFKHGQPTVRMARELTDLDVDISHRSDEARYPNEMDWSLSYWEGCNTWISTINMPINVAKSMPPTFLSVLAARRYSVRFKVEILNLHHSSLVLQVPLQIYFDPQTAGVGISGEGHTNPVVLGCHEIDSSNGESLENESNNYPPLPGYER